MPLNEEYKKKIINLIVALQPTVKIYLFGSQADNTQVHGSDIDIALDAGARMKIVDVGEIREILNATNIPHKIDVVDFHFVSSDMQRMILKYGILWKN
jgi:predicted nucleotidyltransferase